MALREKIDVLRRGTVGEGLMPPQLSFILHLPGRGIVQFSPAQLADRLGLEPTSRVLEVGCGSGYFSVEIARRAPSGELTMLDLQPEMLEKARKRVKSAGLTNVALIEADIATGNLPNAHFDVAFLVDVLGEVEDRPGCVEAIHRVLRSGGLLSISENGWVDPDFKSQHEVRELCEPRGFALEEIIGSTRNYTANFRNLESAAAVADGKSG